VAGHFEYPCPDCRTTNNLHGVDCRFAGRPWAEVERAYVDIVGVLSTGSYGERELQRAIPGEWTPLHHAALDQLTHSQRVQEEGDGLRLLTPAEFREAVQEPTIEPMATIYHEGSVPGCHDHAVFAMVAYYEMVGLSWEETRENVVQWLEDSGSWARGGWEEETPRDVVENKRHVYEEGYGWKQAAQEAVAVIDRRA